MRAVLSGATGRSSSGTIPTLKLNPSPHPHPHLPLTLALSLTRHATNAPHIHGEDHDQPDQPWTGKPELLERVAHVCESGCGDRAYDTRHYAAVVLAMDEAFEATNAALQRHGMLDDALQVPLELTCSLAHHLTTSPPHHLTTSPPHHLTTSASSFLRHY